MKTIIEQPFINSFSNLYDYKLRNVLLNHLKKTDIPYLIYNELNDNKEKPKEFIETFKKYISDISIYYDLRVIMLPVLMFKRGFMNGYTDALILENNEKISNIIDEDLKPQLENRYDTIVRISPFDYVLIKETKLFNKEYYLYNINDKKAKRIITYEGECNITEDTVYNKEAIDNYSIEDNFFEFMVCIVGEQPIDFMDFVETKIIDNIEDFKEALKGSFISTKLALSLEKINNLGELKEFIGKTIAGETVRDVLAESDLVNVINLIDKNNE